MALDRLFGIFKVGDQQTAIGKEHFGIKDAMLIQLIDELDWRIPIDNILSPNMHRVYCAIEFDRKMKPLLVEGSLPIGIEADKRGIPAKYIPDILKYRPRKYKVDFDEIAIKCGDPDLVAKLRDKDIQVPIINGITYTDEIFKPTLSVSNDPIIPDRNSITTGSYTIGSGKNYATVALFVADFGNLTGDLTGTTQTSITETASATGTETLNGHTLTFDSDLPPKGDATSGRQVAINANVDWLYCDYAGTGTIVIKNLYPWRQYVTDAGYADIVIDVPSTISVSIHDNYVDHTDRIGMCLAFYNSGGGLAEVYNNYFIKCQTYACVWFNDSSEVSTSSLIENNTVGEDTGFDLGSGDMTLRNNIAWSDTGFINHEAATGYNNASFDWTAADGYWAVGEENAVKIVASDFESVTYGAANYLKPARGGVCANGGRAVGIALNTYGVRLNDRPHDYR